MSETLYPSMMKKQYLVLNEKDVFMYCPNCGHMSGSMTVKQNISIIENMKENHEYSFSPQNIRFVEPIIECPECKKENMVLIDYGLRESIKALNTIPFVVTTNCCEGHMFNLDIRPYIQFWLLKTDQFIFPLMINNVDGKYYVIEPKTEKEFILPKGWKISTGNITCGAVMYNIEHTTYLEDIKKFRNNGCLFDYKSYNKYKEEYLRDINTFCMELQMYISTVYLEEDSDE